MRAGLVWALAVVACGCTPFEDLGGINRFHRARGPAFVILGLGYKVKPQVVHGPIKGTPLFCRCGHECGTLEIRVILGSQEFMGQEWGGHQDRITRLVGFDFVPPAVV